MRTSKTTAALLAMISPLSALAAAPAATQAASRPALATLAHTQAVLDAAVQAGKLPGLTVVIGHGDAPPLFVSAGRIANDKTAAAADGDTLWRVYSMTKPITAAAAMILVDEGRIALDDPVSKYLPGFATMRVLVDPAKGLESRPAIRPVTIRELLTHSSGLAYSILPDNALAKEYERQGIVPAAVGARLEAAARRTRPATLQAFADKVPTLPLLFEPGTKWSYSIGLDVMGAVIEKVSGVPFDQFVTARIFRPLGMTSSFWTVPADQAGRLATNYYPFHGIRLPIDPGATSVWLQPPTFPYGGAGLVMSARDYDVFLAMIQDGGKRGAVRIMRPQTVALMTGDLLPPGVTFPGVSASGMETTGSDTPQGFAAGGLVYLADAPTGFPGKGTYGWGGAAGTSALVDRARRIRVTVMLNVMGGVPKLREDLFAALAQDGVLPGPR